MIKSRFSSILVAAAALLTGLASCNDDNSPAAITGLVDDGDPTTLTVAFSQPRTYATALSTATDYEAQLSWVDVFIYNTSGALVKSERLSSSDFDYDNINSSTTSDIWKGKASIVTTTGPKVVYAGVNLPDNIVSNIKASGVSVVNNITLSDLNNGTDGLAMFSVLPEAVTLVEDANQNEVDIEVSRLVAKVAVKTADGLNLNVTGGTLSDLNFAMRNSNTQIYALPQWSGNNLIDPNWSWTTFNSSWFEDLDTYDPVNANTITDVRLLTAKYVPENTSENYLEKETTYAAIRANFVPSTIKTSGGNGTFNDETNTAGVGTTFYTVAAGSGNIAYFLDQNVAEEYATANGLTATDVMTYTNGVCYYNLFLNPTKKFDVDRNTYYVATITEIVGLGSHNDEENDPEEPVSLTTTLKFNIEIIDWELQEDDYVLVL